MYLVFGTQLVKIKLKYNPLPQCTFANVSFLFHKLFKTLYCFIYGAFQISIRDPMWPPHGDQLLNTLRTANRHIRRTFNLTEVNLKRWYLFLKQRRLFFFLKLCIRHSINEIKIFFYVFDRETWSNLKNIAITNLNQRVCTFTAQWLGRFF